MVAEEWKLQQRELHIGMSAIRLCGSNADPYSRAVLQISFQRNQQMQKH